MSTETDRELLECAAKAAAVSLKYDENSKTFWRTVPETNRCAAHETPWNPLSDDGDAFRLAVRLGLGDVITLNVGCAAATVEFDSNSAIGYEVHQEHTDPYAATRRAIVRAAAEIGKAMP